MFGPKDHPELLKAVEQELIRLSDLSKARIMKIVKTTKETAAAKGYLRSGSFISSIYRIHNDEITASFEEQYGYIQQIPHSFNIELSDSDYDNLITLLQNLTRGFYSSRDNEVKDLIKTLDLPETPHSNDLPGALSTISIRINTIKALAREQKEPAYQRKDFKFRVAYAVVTLVLMAISACVSYYIGTHRNDAPVSRPAIEQQSQQNLVD